MATLAQFARRMRQLGRNVEENAPRATRRVALAVLQTVVTSTPVDTGRARSNWVVSSSGVPRRSERDAFSPGEGGSTAEQNSEVAISVGGQEIDRYRGQVGITISNNLPYIEALNDGSSAQAPAGFVETAVQVGRSVARRQRVLR